MASKVGIVKQEELIASLKEIQRLVSSCLAAMGEGKQASAKANAGPKAKPISSKQSLLNQLFQSRFALRQAHC
jgi:hypothetical protein